MIDKCVILFVLVFLFFLFFCMKVKEFVKFNKEMESEWVVKERRVEEVCLWWFLGGVKLGDGNGEGMGIDVILVILI